MNFIHYSEIVLGDDNMPKKNIENHQNENFSGIENSRKYAEESEKSSKMRFRGFLQKLENLNIKLIIFFHILYKISLSENRYVL